MPPINKPSSGHYDLEDRTLAYARRVRTFIKKVPPSVGHIEDCKQVVRSSGSVGANYIEANESLGKKDFLMRIRMCRKEAKESRFWLNLLQVEGNAELAAECKLLIQESLELTRIFGAILTRCEEREKINPKS